MEQMVGTGAGEMGRDATRDQVSLRGEENILKLDCSNSQITL